MSHDLFITYIIVQFNNKSGDVIARFTLETPETSRGEFVLPRQGEKYTFIDHVGGIQYVGHVDTINHKISYDPRNPFSTQSVTVTINDADSNKKYD